jgi:hypothetical protein
MKSPKTYEPQLPKRELPPPLVLHGQRVKQAHAHLTKTDPTFAAKPFAERAKHVQAHIRSRR